MTANPLILNGGRYWDRTSDPYDVNVIPSFETRSFPPFSVRITRERTENMRHISRNFRVSGGG